MRGALVCVLAVALGWVVRVDCAGGLWACNNLDPKDYGTVFTRDYKDNSKGWCANTCNTNGESRHAGNMPVPDWTGLQCYGGYDVSGLIWTNQFSLGAVNGNKCNFQCVEKQYGC